MGEVHGFSYWKRVQGFRVQGSEVQGSAQPLAAEAASLIEKDTLAL